MYLIFDTETGGRTVGYSLLQLHIAVVDPVSLKVLGERNFKIHPDDGMFRVSAEALQINQINLSEHKKTSLPYKVASNYLRMFLTPYAAARKRFTPVGWNVAFDVDFILAHLLPKDEWDQMVNYRLLDLASVCEILKAKGKLPATLTSLTSVAKHFGINIENAHDASADVRITLDVLKKLLVLI